MVLGKNWFGRWLQRMFGPARITREEVAQALLDAKAAHPKARGISLDTAATAFLRRRYKQAREDELRELVQEERRRAKEVDGG